MPRIWTHGVWTVKAGREDDFVSAWREMALGAMEELQAREKPYLFRDREHPNVFRSFGYWESPEEVAAFRGFIRPHLERIRELTDGIEMLSLDEMYPSDG
jgi:heme-degrading monooxygenase HmoA